MGTSLLTNQSAMNALQTLRSIGDNMDITQRRVSTGLRINEASDNTAYWSISSMMKSDRNALSSVSDAMALGKSQIDVANATIDKSKEYLDNIQKSLTTAYEKGSGDIKKIQADIKANMNDIQSAVYSASLAEKNILGNGGESVRIAGSYRREGSNVYVDMIDVGGADLNFATKQADGTFDLTKGVLKDVFGKAETAPDFASLDSTLQEAQAALAAKGDTATEEDKNKVTQAQQAITEAAKDMTVQDFVDTDFSKVSSATMEQVLKTVQSKVTNATSNVVTAGAALGAAKAQVTGQIDYVSKLMDAVDKGVGSLVDADMNAESARLASLQVQQQLGIQALSIANQNSQNILSLFRQ
ncbi:flagellin [Bartonella sp. W8097]|uniref:flagellin N-terminal helical domain-containing protein n=1 Tax=Bartonella apihabitans TaxID=2750929 RepID=UPI0018DB00F4|nr:flagellin [Bartonella apihabitans]MBI0021676.1 flagellin [Bartonella apihabitans]